MLVMLKRSVLAPFMAKGLIEISPPCPGMADIQLTSTQPHIQRTSRSMLDKDISKIIKDEISEMQDWIPFSSALGACGIHARRATNHQVEQVAETVKSDPRLLTAFYVMGESMDFEKDSMQFNEKIDEVLATDDANARMYIMTKIFRVYGFNG